MKSSFAECHHSGDFLSLKMIGELSDADLLVMEINLLTLATPNFLARKVREDLFCLIIRPRALTSTTIVL